MMRLTVKSFIDTSKVLASNATPVMFGAALSPTPVCWMLADDIMAEETQTTFWFASRQNACMGLTAPCGRPRASKHDTTTVPANTGGETCASHVKRAAMVSKVIEQKLTPEPLSRTSK
jgi:hypothetical protein